MPKPLSFTPPWLSRPSDGFEFLQPSPSKSGATSHTTPIAHRGTEIFAAVGNELRWTDFVLLKEEWEAADSNKRHTAALSGRSMPKKYPWRTLKTPVTREIKRLLVSPGGALLAIITTHTIHIALLPDSSHLSVTSETTPIRLKTFHLGPTDHVLERSRIASALWHPLGVHGSCLVTVTADAIVRLWELDADNRCSFDKPALAVDLKKLANGTGTGQDYSPSKYSTSKGFSPDDFELEVASARFGGLGHDKETGWASLTLWLAMKGGDVYALCPLLPSRWAPPPSLVSTLISSVSMASAADEPKDMQSLSKRIIWVSDLDEQANSSAMESGIFKRPSQASAVPMLQGPLQIRPVNDDVFDVADLFIIAGKESDENSGLTTFDDAEPDRESVQVGIVLIATSDGRVHVCLDIEGVEARWPIKGARLFTPERQASYPELLLLETLEASKSSTNAGILFTEDAASRNAVFVSHEHGVSHLDFSSWTRKLREELEGFDSGTDFRLDLFIENARTHVQHILRIADPRARLAAPSNLMANGEGLPESSSSKLPTARLTLPASDVPREVSAAINIVDADLGHFLFTVTNRIAHSATLDDPTTFSLSASDASDYSPESNPLALAQIDPDNKHATPADLREAYQPPSIFWEDSNLLSLPKNPNLERYARLMNHPVQISPLTLNFLIEAHRVLAAETTALGEGAADLFRRCERLRDELREQVRRDADVAARIDSVLNEDADDYTAGDGQTYGVNAAIERRIDAAHVRQQRLDARYAELKRRAATLAGRPLSDKEREWRAQIETMARGVGVAVVDTGDDDGSVTPANETLPHMRPSRIDDDDDGADDNYDDGVADGIAASMARVKIDNGAPATACARLAEVKDLRTALLARATAHIASSTAGDDPAAAAAAGVSSDADDLGASRTSLSQSQSKFGQGLPGPRHVHAHGLDSRRTRQSHAHITEMLERETALVDAAARKAVRLGGWVLMAGAAQGQGQGQGQGASGSPAAVV